MANSQTFTFNIKAVADMKDVQSNIQNIQNALSKLKLPDNLKTSFKTTFDGLEKELNNYQKLMANGIKTKGDSNALTKSGNNILRLYDDVIQKIKSIDDATLRKVFEDIGANQAEEQIKSLRQELESLENDLKSKLDKQEFINFDKAKSDLKSFKTSITGLTGDAEKAFKTLSNSTFNTFTKNIDAGRLDLAAQNLAKIKQQVDAIKNDKLTDWYTNLANGFQQLSGDSNIAGLISQISNLKSQLIDIEASTLTKLVNEFKQGTISAEQFQGEVNKLVTSTNEWGQAQAQTNKEIDQVKSRIQYFLGLNNAINLVKRAIRGAVETIKDLDAAMTETAVVTDYTVKDMWNQLPEYTKRANELGVMTKDAYESATLYFQQGLNADQAAALSVETLKMARIAGLDAAEATDRMTNALRGFNMELNTTSAQRVDDVYSQLAAMSASNVDEISTAMTKVASLAHSANMEFETTAAFLAQIIETTRESAETAGTALKTVAARFSEVKKLVDTDQLKGTDEEGQVVDVNKVSAALRTAGIDLNKYFLGEVGLDDIFMELASKWDSLTNVQQRYIATQAAGSRQQSRFIALMQDYARTQELVSAAYNAEGASARQFEKTQDSLQSKLARLKNAWNEFLMGLTNNTLVKGMVDALTNIINLVNKLTSAFGDGLGTIMKWTVAIGGLTTLRNLFSDKGLGTKLIGSLLKNTPIGKILGVESSDEKTANLSMIEQVKIAWLNAIEQVKAAGITAEEAEGATAIVQEETEGAVSVAQEETEGAVSVAQEETEGVVSVAQEKAEEAAAIAGETAELLASQKNKFGRLFNLKPSDAYLANMGIGTAKAGAGAGGTAGLGAVLKAFFGSTAGTALSIGGFATLLAALEAGAIGLQDYVTSGKAEVKKAERTVEKQNKILDDSSDLNKKQKEAYNSYIENQQKAYNATNSLERAQAEAEMAAALQELAAINPNNVINNGAGLSLNTSYAQEYIKTLDAQERENKAALAFEEARVALAKEQLELGKQYAVEWDETTGLAFAHAYSGSLWEGTKHSLDSSATPDALESQANAWNTQQQAIAEKFSSEAKLKIAEGAATLLEGIVSDETIIDTISTAYSEIISPDSLKEKTSTDIQSELSKLIDIASNENGKLLLNVINGSYEGIVNEDIIQEAFDKLNSFQKTAIQNLLGTDSIDATYAALNKYSANLQKTQAVFRKQTTAALKKAGLTSVEQLDKISNELSLTQQNKLVDIADSLTDFGSEFSGLVLDSVSSAMLAGEWEQSDLQNFLGNISDNPVLTLQAINDEVNKIPGGAANATTAVQKLAVELQKITFDAPEFSQTAQIQYYFASDEYNELSDQISELSKESGKISAAGVEELAKTSKTLNALLESGIGNARGFANAINAVESGVVTFQDLDENIIKCFSDFTSLNDLISEAKDWRDNFPDFEDYGEALDFIESKYKAFKDMVDNYEVGNPALVQGIQQFLEFGQTAPETQAEWAAFLDTFNNILVSDQGQNFWSNIMGWKETPEGYFDSSVIDSIDGYTDLINQVQAAWDNSSINKYGTKISKGFAENLIENLLAHDEGQKNAKLLAEREANNMIEAYSEGLVENVQPSQEQLALIGEHWGLTPEQVWEEVKKSHPEWNDIDFGNLNVKAKLPSLSEVLAAGGIVDTGYGAADLSALLKKLGANEDDTFDLGTLYAKIREIVPQLADSSDGDIASYVNGLIQEAGGEVELPVTVKTAAKQADGTWIEEINTQTAAAVNSIQQYQSIAENIQNAVDTEVLGQSLINPIDNAQELVTNLSTALTGLEAKVDITVAQQQIASLDEQLKALHTTVGVSLSAYNISLDAGGGTAVVSLNLAHTGGLVQSFAKGSEGYKIKPGVALTGEIGPEIVWNGEKGYAYIAGLNGPEFNDLQSGDKIFNAEETKQILKSSGSAKYGAMSHGGEVNSYGFTFKPTSSSNGSGGGGSGSGSKDKGKKESTWRNELDWLYDLMEDIAEYERQQTIIQSKYELALNDLGKTGRDLFNLTRQELRNLNTQYKAQSDALLKRTQQMGELQTLVNSKGFQKYVQWNQKDQTLEINWDKIEAIQDKERYDEVTEFINRMEEVQDQMDDAEKALYDIKKQIQELEERFLQQYLDFQKRVLDAVVKQYQTTIDNLSELNDTLNDANSSILDSLQKEIDLQRQIRDNTDTEQNIADMEARLAYLQRDTTGANAQEIRELEKQLSDARQDYSDTLIDQEIDRLNEANDTATTQREKQIELMQAQLDYWQESGGLWDEVADLIAGGFTNQGTIIGGSDLWEVLKQADSWEALSEAQKKNWANELILETNEVGAHLIQLSGGNAIDFEKVRASIATNGDLAIKAINAGADTVRASIASLKGKMGGTPAHSYTAEKVEGYASGGTATSTAMALLHGTPQEPEYVLNARQTDAFLRLADILPAAMGGNTNTPSNVFGGDTIFNIGINVDSIANDYDVDQLVERIKDDLADAAGYRNVNALSFIR